MSFALVVANQGNQSRVPEFQLQNCQYGVKDGVPTLQPRFQTIPLSNRQYGQVDGKPAVYFSVVEIEAGVALFKHSLVVKFTVGRPPITEIRRVFKENWLIKGCATISDIWDGRHLMIILDSKEDDRIALTSPIRKITILAVNLQQQLNGLDSLDYIQVSLQGTMWQVLESPLAIFFDLDNYTKACASLKYTRACVEVGVAKPILEEVTIVLSDGRKFCQRVEVEGNMAYTVPFGDDNENGNKSDVKDSQEGWTVVKTNKKNRNVNFTSIPKEKRVNEEKVSEPLDNGDIPKSGNNENGNNENEDILEGELLPELHNDDDNTKEVVDAMGLMVYKGDEAVGSAHGEERE
ncbi:hypothetical protein QQ045_011692 [Rhodiola kirilowii]